ncbi:MAG TPA: hypothetical protein VF095_06315 [Bacillota bacterium]
MDQQKHLGLPFMTIASLGTVYIVVNFSSLYTKGLIGLVSFIVVFALFMSSIVYMKAKETVLDNHTFLKTSSY